MESVSHLARLVRNAPDFWNNFWGRHLGNRPPRGFSGGRDFRWRSSEKGPDYSVGQFYRKCVDDVKVRAGGYLWQRTRRFRNTIAGKLAVPSPLAGRDPDRQSSFSLGRRAACCPVRSDGPGPTAWLSVLPAPSGTGRPMAEGLATDGVATFGFAYRGPRKGREAVRHSMPIPGGSFSRYARCYLGRP
mgnify:CR=1 FL=1